MNGIRLQFPNREHDDLILTPGVCAVGRDDAGVPAFVDAPERTQVQFCIDRRGLWLQVSDGVRGVHVNGRPVRHVAMLRLGDAIHLDGYRLTLCGTRPVPPPDATTPPPVSPMLLRGIGGPHHGRAFPLERPILVGRSRTCDVHVDEPGFADRHARLEPHAEGVALRDLGSEAGSTVDGWSARHAWLRPGAQVLFGTRHRFVIEAPTTPPLKLPSDPSLGLELSPHRSEGEHAPLERGGTLRVPWLLLAALLMAGLLSLLLLFGAR